jgi:Cof subfamily protein (haloacid dehalogenase superfamily)
MATVDLVVTDLDGTLWDGQERIHTRTLAALTELEDRGLPLLVATGRRLRSAAATLARSGLTPPAVVLDGALGRELATGRTFHHATLATDDAAAVLDTFLANGIEPCVYVDLPDIDVFVGEHPSTNARHLEWLAPNLARDDLRQVVRREHVLAFAVTGVEERPLRAILQGVAGHASGSVAVDALFGGASITVRPHGVSKWEGVLAWCDDQGLDPGRVLAVGDGENDVELLSAAKIACAISTGSQAALALADHVIPSPDEGGWSAILELCA